MTQRFNEWSAAQKIESKLTLASFGGLRGAAVASDLEAETRLVEVPFASALAVTPGMPCPLPATWCSRETWQRQPPFVKMALLLLHHRSMGAESRLAAYLAALPSEFDTLLHWSPAELALLQYPHALELQSRRKREVRGYYDSLRASSPSFPPSADEWTWAMDCVQSRLFSGPYAGRSLAARAQLATVVLGLAVGYAVGHPPTPCGDQGTLWMMHGCSDPQALGLGPAEQALNGAIAALAFNLIYDSVISQKLSWFAMCPVIDMINHSSSVQSEVSYQYFSDRFTVECGRKFRRGEQALISYGGKSNDQLLLYYGFAEEGNPNDSYVLGGEGLRGRVREAAGGKDLPGPLPEELVVTRQGLTEVSLEGLASALGTDAAAARAVGLRLLEQEMGSKATSLGEDEGALAKRGKMGSREQVALVFRLEKKRVLADALKAMRARA